jgi:DNA-binding PadR family transcriptional regulator
MVPDTRYAILGLLVRHGQSHGYELAVRFGELFGPGWQINRGQVYNMLHTLEAEGWVEPVPGPGGRRRVLRYRATGNGEHAFAAWLSKPCAYTRVHRDALYLQLALARPQDARHLLESIAIQKQACVDRLQAYAEAPYRARAGADEWEILAREAIDEATTTELHGDLDWLSKMERRVEGWLARSESSDAIGDAPSYQRARASA